MNNTISHFQKRIDETTKLFTVALSEKCQFLIDDFVKNQSDHNQDVYCFFVAIYTGHYQFEVSINTEAVWENGYGSAEDLEPAELTINGLRFSKIGYCMEVDGGKPQEEMSEIISELYDLSISTDDSEFEIEALNLMHSISPVMQEIAVNATSILDLSKLNKTPKFCVLLVDHEQDWDEQLALARRTVTQDVDELFPYVERRDERMIDPDIIALAPEEQASKIVEYIIHYHNELDPYTASNNFDILMDAETRLIKLRPHSDAVIAETFNNLGSTVKTYYADTPEYEEHGSYNKAFHILNALLDMAGGSEEPLTPKLEEALTDHLKFVADNNSKYDAECLSTQVSYALSVWSKGKYPCPV